MTKASPEARASTKESTPTLPLYHRKIQRTKETDPPAPVIKARERDWIFHACSSPPPALSIALETAGLVASAALTFTDTSSLISPSWVSRLTPLALGIAAYGAFHSNIYLLGVPTPRQLELDAIRNNERLDGQAQNSEPAHDSGTDQDSERAHDSSSVEDRVSEEDY